MRPELALAAPRAVEGELRWLVEVVAAQVGAPVLLVGRQPSRLTLSASQDQPDPSTGTRRASPAPFTHADANVG